jgi:hypothetical protein
MTLSGSPPILNADRRVPAASTGRLRPAPTDWATDGRHAGWVVNEDVRGPAREQRRHGAGMPVRHADLDDADEVIRLAGLMYEAMGVDASGEAWCQTAADHLRRRLPDAVMVAVVDDPTRSGRLAATGAGVITAHCPDRGIRQPGWATSSGFILTSPGVGVDWLAPSCGARIRDAVSCPALLVWCLA